MFHKNLFVDYLLLIELIENSFDFDFNVCLYFINEFILKNKRLIIFKLIEIHLQEI